MSFVDDARQYLLRELPTFEARLTREGYVHRLIFHEHVNAMFHGLCAGLTNASYGNHLVSRPLHWFDQCKLWEPFDKSFIYTLYQILQERFDSENGTPAGTHLCRAATVIAWPVTSGTSPSGAIASSFS